MAYDADQSEAHLAALLAAARAPHKVVFEVGANLLAGLGTVWAPARQAWRTLASDRIRARLQTAPLLLDQP